MSLDRSVPIDEQIKALLGAEARRWTKTLRAEHQAWLARLGPRQAFPEWMLDLSPGGDFTPLADQISAFAGTHLPPGLRERVFGAMGDSIYVMAAGRLLPAGRSLADALAPLLEEIWGALNENDHTSVLLALPAIAGLAGQARQMLADVDLPNEPPGRPEGSGIVMHERASIVDEARRRVAEGVDRSAAINDLAPRLLAPHLPTKAAAPSIESARSYLRANVPAQKKPARD